jgi:anti-anti-sigma regulatory factor
MAALPAGDSKLQVGRTANGFVLRVQGRGTMRESRVAHEFAMRCLPDAGSQMTIDLSACDYLDSTFQGCLLDLQKRFGRGAASRFAVANPSDKCRKLLGAAHVDRFLNLTTNAPQAVGEELPIPPETLDSHDMAKHVMECHRLLAELGGPQQAAFAKIADHMARELETKGRPAPPA